MMIIEPPIAVRFHADNNRSMWSADDVNCVRCVASCRLPWSCGFDGSRVRCKIYTGTPFTKRNKLLRNRIRASLEHMGAAQDPVKKNEKSSYHPFEELAVLSSENRKMQHLPVQKQAE